MSLCHVCKGGDRDCWRCGGESTVCDVCTMPSSECRCTGEEQEEWDLDAALLPGLDPYDDIADRLRHLREAIE